MLVTLDKAHEGIPLLLGQCDSLLGVILHHVGQLEVKGISAQNFFLVGHLKSGLHNAADAGNGTVAPAVLLQLHEPELCVRGFDIPDSSLSKSFFFHKT